MPKNVLGLTREQLAKFLPDNQSIRTFEQLVLKVSIDTPETVEEATNLANSALAMAAAAISSLAQVAEALEEALTAPVSLQQTNEEEDFSNRPYGAMGTLAFQNEDDVEITGGAITVTSVSYSGQLTSTVATGTAPMVVASTTKVANLNVDLLDGGDWATPGAIGSGTPNTGAFTTLATNGTGNSNLGTDSTNSGVNFRGANSGVGGGAFWAVKNGGANILVGGNKSAINGGAYDATPYIFGSATIEFSVGIKVLGGAVFLSTSSALTNGAAAAAATLLNAPVAGNPTKWIAINDNGTVRYIPAW